MITLDDYHTMNSATDVATNDLLTDASITKIRATIKHTFGTIIKTLRIRQPLSPLIASTQLTLH